jgi:hypothetical protein
MVPYLLLPMDVCPAGLQDPAIEILHLQARSKKQEVRGKIGVLGLKV